MLKLEVLGDCWCVVPLVRIIVIDQSSRQTNQQRNSTNICGAGDPFPRCNQAIDVVCEAKCALLQEEIPKPIKVYATAHARCGTQEFVMRDGPACAYMRSAYFGRFYARVHTLGYTSPG